MKPMRLVALAAMAQSLATVGTAAQTVPTLHCGSEVQINGTTGWLAGVSADSVIVTTGWGERSAFLVPSATETAALRSGGSHWLKGMAFGLVIGGAAGAAVGAVVTEEGAFGGPGLGALIGLVVGAGSGLIVGGMAGGLSPAEHRATMPSDALIAYAQERAPCGPHVRVISGVSDTATEGALIAVQPDRIVLLPTEGSGALSLPRRSVKEIQRPAGTRGHPLIGATAGLAAGAIAAKQLSNTTKEHTGFVVVGGVALGAAVGLAVRTPRWESIRPEDVEFGLVPGPGGVRLSARVSF
jgi:hypothetical protein